MPYVKVWIHFVWSTNDRKPFLETPEMRKLVWKHILINAREKGIFIDHINGYEEHCHCLISLGFKQSMSEVMQMVKGESSYWINKNKICREHFKWQNDFFASSVSESQLPRVRNYIKNQELHHKKHSFKNEIDGFLKRHGFKKFG